MRITFLGTGTSVGVPSVGCECNTCLSDDPRDNRLRTSVLVEHRGQNLLIDASTDFRQQALRIGLKHIAGHPVHSLARGSLFRVGRHPADHVPRWCNSGFYASDVTWQGLRRIYAYALEPNPYPYPGVPRILPHQIEGKFEVLGLKVEPLTVIMVNCR